LTFLTESLLAQKGNCSKTTSFMDCHFGFPEQKREAQKRPFTANTCK
jgi:hypothetical protein